MYSNATYTQCHLFEYPFVYWLPKDQSKVVDTKVFQLQILTSCYGILSEIVVILSFAQLVTTFIFFFA